MFGRLGVWITVRCPVEFVPLMVESDALWEPGARCWLIEPRRIGSVIRHLERTTDPLFRQAGIRPD